MHGNVTRGLRGAANLGVGLVGGSHRRGAGVHGCQQRRRGRLGIEIAREAVLTHDRGKHGVGLCVLGGLGIDRGGRDVRGLIAKVEACLLGRLGDRGRGDEHSAGGCGLLGADAMLACTMNGTLLDVHILNLARLGENAKTAHGRKAMTHGLAGLRLLGARLHSSAGTHGLAIGSEGLRLATLLTAKGKTLGIRTGLGVAHAKLVCTLLLPHLVVRTEGHAVGNGTDALEHAEHGSDARLVVVGTEGVRQHEEMQQGAHAPHHQNGTRDDAKRGKERLEAHGNRQHLHEQGEDLDDDADVDCAGQVRLHPRDGRLAQKVGTGRVVMSDNHHGTGLLTGGGGGGGGMARHHVLARTGKAQAAVRLDAETAVKQIQHTDDRHEHEHDGGDHAAEQHAHNREHGGQAHQRRKTEVAVPGVVEALLHGLKAMLMEDARHDRGCVALLTRSCRGDLIFLREVAHGFLGVGHTGVPPSMSFVVTFHWHVPPKLKRRDEKTRGADGSGS